MSRVTENLHLRPLLAWKLHIIQFTQLYAVIFLVTGGKTLVHYKRFPIRVHFPVSDKESYDDSASTLLHGYRTRYMYGNCYLHNNSWRELSLCIFPFVAEVNSFYKDVIWSIDPPKFEGSRLFQIEKLEVQKFGIQKFLKIIKNSSNT